MTKKETTKQISISKMKLYVVCKNMEKLVDPTSYSPITKQSSHSPQSLSSMQMSRMVCPTLVLLAALLALAASQGFYPQRYGKRPDPRQLTGKLLSSLVLYKIWGILHSSWTSRETHSCKYMQVYLYTSPYSPFFYLSYLSYCVSSLHLPFTFALSSPPLPTLVSSWRLKSG